MTPLRVEIRALRKSKGLSQQALADAVGTGRETVNRLENGQQKSVDLDVLEGLARVLGVSPGALLAHADEQQGRRPARRKRTR